MTPGPARCPVAQPPSIGDLLARIGATPILDAIRRGDDIPAPPVAVPTGQPADAVTVEAVTAVLVQFLACLNTGDVRKAPALTTDRYPCRIEAVAPLTEARGNALAGPLAPLPPDQYSALLAVERAGILPDGRVGMVAVLLFPPAAGAPERAWPAFAWAAGRWWRDDEVDRLPVVPA